MRPGCYDIHERVRDMDANGVLGSMCFPSFPNLCGQLFARSHDKDAALAIVKAYNDWHVDEWCGTYPGRFIPLMIPPLWDPVEMAAEVRRMAAKGCHAVTFSENPEKLKLPSMHAEHWDPFWQACSDEGTIVCLHIGSSSSLVVTAQDAPIDVLITLQPVNIVQCAADLMWSPVLRKFPDLRISLSEGRHRVDPVPPRTARLDLHPPPRVDRPGLRRAAAERGVPRAHRDVLHRRPGRLVVRDRVGIDRICWEADYPHSDSTWPTSPEYLMKSLEQVPGACPTREIDAMTHLNAMRHFRFDPFAAHRREDCTVGALRARADAAGVDTSPLSVESRRSEPKDTQATYLLKRH